MQGFWPRFRRNRGAVLGLVALGGVVALATAAPLLYPGDPFGLAGRPLAPPSREFPLGTDQLGRDVAAGIVHGARTSLLVGIIATAVAVGLGTLAGGLAGYYGRWTDDVLMRITELFQTIPAFILAIALVTILTPSIDSIITAIAVVSWPPVARLVRGQFIALRNREFVQACLALGMKDVRVIVRHVLPNCLSPVIVTGSLMVATAILAESALSFLGLGDPNVISWGFQIGQGRTLLRNAWWVATFPGIAILLTVLAINLVGEGVNDGLNPRLQDAG
jgi:peptide/nickel transport system permease protein